MCPELQFIKKQTLQYFLPVLTILYMQGGCCCLEKVHAGPVTWRTSTSSWQNSRNNQLLFTGDILKGKNHCSIGDLADCLFTCWISDPVHTATKVLR
jgi:hypothetical protein